MEFKTEKVKERFTDLHPRLQGICLEMAEYCRVNGMPFVLTETATTFEEDKALGRKSVTHSEGRAVDIRTRDWILPDRQVFMVHFNGRYGNLGALNSLGDRNLLVYHDSGHGAHIHCQLDTTFKVKKETE